MKATPSQNGGLVVENRSLGWERRRDEIAPYSCRRRVNAGERSSTGVGPLAAYEDHVEVVDVSGSGGGVKHRPADGVLQRVVVELELGGNVEVVQVAGDGVPHQELARKLDEDEAEAVAAAEDPDALPEAVDLEVEAAAGEAVGAVQSRVKGDAFDEVNEFDEADEGRAAAVVGAEAAVEGGVGEEAAPARADGGCAWEGGG